MQSFPQSTVFSLLTRMLREQRHTHEDFYTDVFASLARMADTAKTVRVHSSCEITLMSPLRVSLLTSHLCHGCFFYLLRPHRLSLRPWLRCTTDSDAPHVAWLPSRVFTSFQFLQMILLPLSSCLYSFSVQVRASVAVCARCTTSVHRVRTRSGQSTTLRTHLLSSPSPCLPLLLVNLRWYICLFCQLV